MKVARAVPIVAVLIALVGCGGSKTLTAANVASILPGKADAPAGLDFLPDSSGEQPVSQVVKDDDQQAKFTAYGFQKAYASFYANSGAIAILQQASTPADPTAHVLAMLGIEFKTTDGAHKALALNFQKDVATGTNIKRVAVRSLGDETIAESGTQANFPLPGFLIYWRVGNAVFAVLDAGGPTAGASLETALKYATQMDARAQKI